MPSIEELRNQRGDAKDELSSLNHRKREIQRIISSIDNKFDDNVNHVNSHLEKCISNLSAGLKGCSSAGLWCSKLESLKEHHPCADSKIAGCRDNLSREENRCQQEIDRLEDEVASLKQQIKDQGGIVIF